MKKSAALLLLAILLTSQPSYAQIQVSVGAKYRLSTLYSDTGELQGVNAGFGHQIAPLLRFQYKGVWLQTVIFWGMIPFEYENHWDVYDDAGGNRFRHDYVNQKTSATRNDWTLKLGVDISRGFGVYGMIREIKTRVKADFDYTEYAYNYLDQTWTEIDEGNERFTWLNKKLAYGIGLFYDFPLKLIPVMIQFQGDYLIIDRTGNIDRFNDLFALYGGLRYDLPSGLSIHLGYQADLFGMNRIDEVYHGLEAGMRYPLN